MGGKNSGRFKKGITKKSAIKKPVTVDKKVESPKSKPEPPKIELIEETLDFESNADRILKESIAQIELNKKPEPEIKNENVDQNQNQKDEIKKDDVKIKKEDWSPVVGFAMGIIGQIFEKSTGFKELNYTEQELEAGAVATSDIINVLWPDIKALTEDQKIILTSSMILLKIHTDKLNLYYQLKSEKTEKKEVEKNESTRDAETKPTAA
jgi:hypothetical protein